VEPRQSSSSGRKAFFGLAAVVLLAAVALAVAALANVGPFDDEGGGGLTRAEFVNQGNAICEQGDQQFAELHKSPPRTPQAAAALTAKVIQLSTQELSSLEALQAPASAKPAFERYLAARRDVIATLHKGETAAQNEDAAGYAQAQAEVAGGQVKRARLAREVGFTQCSRPFGGASSGASPSG
jgi:hypothetical protein